jgi:hypothetical protein
VLYRQAVIRYHSILEPQLRNLEDLISDFMEPMSASTPGSLPNSGRSGLLSPLEDEFTARVQFAREQRHVHGVVFSVVEHGGHLYADCTLLGDAFPVIQAEENGFVMALLAADVNPDRPPPLSGAMKPGCAWQMWALVGPSARWDLFPVPGDSEAWDGGQPVEAQEVAQHYAALALRCCFKLTVTRGKPQREAMRRAAEAVEGAIVEERGVEWGLAKDERGFTFKAPGPASRPIPVVAIGHSTSLLATSPLQDAIAECHADSYNVVTAISIGLARGGNGAEPVRRMCTVRAAAELFRRRGNWKWGNLDYMGVLVKARIEEKNCGQAVTFNLRLLPGPAEVRKGLDAQACALAPIVRVD